MIILPTQTGELLPAVGVVGNAFTTKTVVPTKLAHPPTVTVKLYVPAIDNEAPGRVGSSNEEEKAPGPVQL